jgi:hypothetical protein
LTRARKLLTVALVAAALLAGVSLASAASLPLDGGILTSATATRPCPGTATATAATGSGPTYSAVSVTVPAGCANKRLDVTLLNGSTVLRSGTAPVASSGATTVTFTGTYTASSSLTVLAIVDGWNLPTTWSFTLPPIWCTVVSGGDAGATCTATVALRYDTGRAAWYYDVAVTTTSAQWLVWEVGFSLSNSFYGSVPTRLGNSILDVYNDGHVNWDTTQQGGWYGWWAINDVVRTSNCSTLPGSLLVRGENNGPSDDLFQQLRDIRARQFSLVVNISQQGYYDVDSPGCGAP